MATDSAATPKRKKSVDATDTSKKKQKSNATSLKKKGSKNKDVTELLETMPLMATGVRPTYTKAVDPKPAEPRQALDTVGVPVRGIRDQCHGCRLRLHNLPLLPPRTIHIARLREQPEQWQRFLLKLGAHAAYAPLSVEEREKWILEHQEEAELSLGTLDGTEKTTVVVEEAGMDKCQLLTRVDPELLDKWVSERTPIPLRELVKHLTAPASASSESSSSDDDDDDDADAKGKNTKESKKKRNLFFLTGWWTVDENPTIFSVLSAETLGSRTVLYGFDSAQPTWSRTVESKLESKGGQYYLCGPNLAVYLTVPSSSTSPVSMSKVEQEEEEKKRLEFKRQHDALPFPWCKSQLQKLIRERPTKTAELPDGTPIRVDDYLDRLSRYMVVHAGGFVPDLGQRVTGLESCSKRLGVIGFEDSCVSMADARFLFVVSMLAKHHRSWKPSSNHVTRMIKQAVELWDTPRCYTYDSHTKLHPFEWPQTVPTTDAGLSVYCSLLLDELGSFEGDKNMVRDLVNAARANQLTSSRITKRHADSLANASVVCMPKHHAWDQHVCPNGVYVLPYAVVHKLYPPQVMRLPCAPVLKAWFGQVTGHNPRRHPAIDTKSEFVQTVRTAQAEIHRLFTTTTILSPPTVSIARDVDSKVDIKTDIKKQPQYELKTTLPDAFLSGGLGDLRYKKSTMVLLARVHPLQFRVVCAPSRVAKPIEVDEKLRQKALDWALGELASAKGLPWRGNTPPLASWKGVRIRYVNNEFVLRFSKDNKEEKWSACKHLNLQFPLAVQKNQPESVWEKADESFRAYLTSSSLPVVRRLDYYLSRYHDRFRLPNVGRDGGTTPAPEGSTTDMAQLEDLAVGHMLRQLCEWYPAALSVDNSTPMTRLTHFRILCHPLWRHLGEMVRVQLKARSLLVVDSKVIDVKSSSSSSSSGGSSSSSSSARNGSWPTTVEDPREPHPHQTATVDDMIRDDTEHAARAHFIWGTMGSGKTKSMMDYLLWRVDQETLGPYVMYVAPQATLAPSSVPGELAQYYKGLTVHYWIPSAALLKKFKAENPTLSCSAAPRPYCINFLRHDHAKQPAALELLIQQLSSDPHNVLLLDEVHEAFNQTLRSSALQQACHAAGTTVCATGTPVIHRGLYEAEPYLSLLVPYPINRHKNLWTAALSMHAHEPKPKWELKRVLKQAKLSASEIEQYRACMPPLLGGTNTQATSDTMRKGRAVCESVITCAMVTEAVSPIHIFSDSKMMTDSDTKKDEKEKEKEKEKENNETLLVAESAKHLQALLVELQKQKPEWKVDREIIVFDSKKGLNFQSYNRDTVYPFGCVVLAEFRHCKSWNAGRCGRLVKSEYPGSLPSHQQAEGRLTRGDGQERSVIQIVTVVDDRGLKTKLVRMHQLPREQTDLLKMCLSS